jgi:uncharacterized membrane protein YciS (DUF1049 family)
MLIASALGTVTLLVVVFMLGIVIGAVIGIMSGEAYLTNRECRECMRRIVKYGFSHDGKNYSAVEDPR